MFDLPPGAAFSTMRGGILIGVRRSLISRLTECRHEVLERGRASSVTLRTVAGDRLCVVAVHLDPGLSAAGQRRFLRRVQAVGEADASLPIILIGDWDFISDAGERIRSDDLGREGGDTMARTFDAMFEAFGELWQPLPTFGRVGDAGMSVVSRIDRAYSNIVAPEAAAWFWSVIVSGALHSVDRPSDHLPLMVKISERRARSARLLRISAELVRTFAHRACFGRLSEGLCRGGGLSEQYEALVEVAHNSARAAQAVIFAPNLTEPALLAEAAMRVYILAKSGRDAQASPIAASVPRVARIWDEGRCAPSDLLRAYRNWSEESVLIRTAALEKRDILEYDRRARMSQMQRHHATIKRMRRRQGAASWYSERGEPLQTPEEIGDALGAFWGEVYQEVSCDSESAQDLLRFVQVCDGSEWSWDRGHTQELASRVRDSAPGQDGLSYAFWAEALACAHSLLDDIAESAQEGGEMPMAFKDSIAVTIPKGEVLEEVAVVRCSVGAIRPVALMQTGCKLIGLRANEHLASVAEGTVAAPQKGFVRGRHIEDCHLWLGRRKRHSESSEWEGCGEHPLRLSTGISKLRAYLDDVGARSHGDREADGVANPRDVLGQHHDFRGHRLPSRPTTSAPRHTTRMPHERVLVRVVARSIFALAYVAALSGQCAVLCVRGRLSCSPRTDARRSASVARRIPQMAAGLWPHAQVVEDGLHPIVGGRRRRDGDVLARGVAHRGGAGRCRRPLPRGHGWHRPPRGAVADGCYEDQGQGSRGGQLRGIAADEAAAVQHPLRQHAALSRAIRATGQTSLAFMSRRRVAGMLRTLDGFRAAAIASCRGA